MSTLKTVFALLCVASIVVTACGGDAPEGEVGPDRDASQVDDAGGDVSSEGVVVTCFDDDEDGYGDGCQRGFDCNDGNPAVHEGAVELCDEVDNDCDDEIDEGCPCIEGSIQACYSGAEGTLGVGRCQAGWRVCEGGVWGNCQSEVVPQQEQCDGSDNDCDGQVDEDLTNACGTCGRVPDEECGDGLDNDCDGTIDESEAGCDCQERTRQPCYGGPPQTLGVGVCRGGTADCVDGDWGRCRGQVVPTTEVCDGLDNDCNGLIDEGLTNSCGVCGAPNPREVCDGEDNDCDGDIDEGLLLVCGLCSAEGLTEDCGDGLDNDCDGEVDEACACVGDPGCYPGPPDKRGVGACREGTRTCDGSGEFWGPCTDFVLPQPEICDGVDNDCDGEVDLSPLGCDVCGTPPEACDGIDNDCDGSIDEFLRNDCDECLVDVVPEESCGAACCDGEDNDCDGLTDESLVNACGKCDEWCYEETWGADEGNFDEGESNGLSEDLSEGLRLGSRPFIYPYLWVANSGEATVSKINTQTFTLEATYPVGQSPSRTAVDLDGNVWVANRAFGGQGSVTKIQAEECEGNECILFTRNIGAVNDIPRGMAIDENDFAWVGTYNGRQLFQLENETGAIVNTYDVSVHVYGLAIDSEGTVWISTLNDGMLGAFDIEERRQVPGSPWLVPDCGRPYGIAIDGNGHVWLGNWTCNGILEFDPDTRTFTAYSPGSGLLQNVRGVGVDAGGLIWTVATNTDRLGRYDPAHEEWRTFETCDGPMGVGVTSSGNIWTPCWSGDVYYFDSLGAYQGNVRAGLNPYSYSDMTGFQLRTFTARQGTWMVVYDCGWPVCRFDQVSWDADTPVGTNVRVRARSSTDAEAWSPRVGPFETTPAELDALPDGRYLELEVTLTTTDRDISPLVRSIEVLWQRP